MTVAYWVVAGLLAVFFLYSGVLKVSRTKEQLAPMMGWVDTVPMPVVRLIGTVEILGAIPVSGGPGDRRRGRLRDPPGARRSPAPVPRGVDAVDHEPRPDRHGRSRGVAGDQPLISRTDRLGRAGHPRRRSQ